MGGVFRRGITDEPSALGGGWHNNNLMTINKARPTYCHISLVASAPSALTKPHPFSATMALPDTWLMGVLNAGGSSEPLPVPQIPADYLQRPRRQRPASEQTRPLSSHLPPPPASFSSLNRRRAALAEIDDPNSQPQRKRQRVPKAPTPVVLQVPPLPSKLQSHIAARKVEDTRNKAPAVDVMDDPSVTPRPFRTRRKLASTPVTALDETAKPALIPSASEDKIGIDREDMEPASSVTESIGSKRSRSPTKRMVDLQVAEKKVVPKTAKSPADVPEDVRGLYRAIQSLARVPRGVIPLGIEVPFQPHSFFILPFTHNSSRMKL
jgi:hypothetical protein